MEEDKDRNQTEEEIERKIQERKEKLKSLLKKDKLLSTFLILAVLSLIHIFFPSINQLTRVSLDKQVWQALFLTFIVASLLCYKNMKKLLYLPGVFIVTFISVFIRTRNMPGLKDVTNGNWTLGPDLDPFLFLRYARNIVENGSLFTHDPMRYVPLGFNTLSETRLLPYMMAYTQKILSFFISDVTTEYAAVVFPVIMFALTAPAALSTCAIPCDPRTHMLGLHIPV